MPEGLFTLPVPNARKEPIPQLKTEKMIQNVWNSTNTAPAAGFTGYIVRLNRGI